MPRHRFCVCGLLAIAGLTVCCPSDRAVTSAESPTITLTQAQTDEAIRELVHRGAVIKRFEVREAETAGLLVRLKAEHLNADGRVDSRMIDQLARLSELALELRGLPLSDDSLKALLERTKPIGLDVSG